MEHYFSFTFSYLFLVVKITHGDGAYFRKPSCGFLPQVYFWFIKYWIVSFCVFYIQARNVSYKLS